MPAFIDRTGARFGRLVAVSLAATGRGVKWSCVCDCGSDVVVSSSHLGSGHTQSCGCLHLERASEANLKHGQSTYPNGGRATKLYNTWTLMKRRCLNPKSADYPDYGGRGIRAHEAWLCFEAFANDMGQPPSSRHSIDRIDVNADYCPSNCRWATPSQQARNKRQGKITVNGECRSLIEWAAIVGISNKRIHSRMKRGWSAHRAIFTPVQR